MAAYWITLRRNKQERLGFSCKTVAQTLEAVERFQREGWDEVRIIDPDGDETSLYALERALASVEVESV